MKTDGPASYGAPAKFSEWRKHQDTLFWDMVACDRRFSIRNAPVGSGKSPAYMAAATLLGGRTAVVTASKGLQKQLVDDFGAVGLFDMRGLQNYTCHALEKGGEHESLWVKHWGRPTCDNGLCHVGLRCSLKDTGGCDYFVAYARAHDSMLVVTNYAYWIAIHMFGQGLGKFDRVIFDECHEAPDQIASMVAVEFEESDFRAMQTQPPRMDDITAWRIWSRAKHREITGHLESFQNGASIESGDSDSGVVLTGDTSIPDAMEVRQWRKLEAKCRTISESRGDWVAFQDRRTKAITLSPVWASRYAESALFLKIPRVIMVSATVRPKTMDLLGIDREQAEFTEYPSNIPVRRRPLYWVPTVRMGRKTPESDLVKWVARIDQIIGRRQDRKGIIHTVSYRLQQFLLANSRFSNIMLANTTGNTRAVVDDFRKAKAPCVLVSPSVGTGWDFPGDEARYQIISKLPFRDTRDAIASAQLEDDPDFSNYLTSQDLIQQYGRINRAPTDFGETFIIDDHIEWFIKRYTDYFPQYFREAFKQSVGMPVPPDLERASVA